MTFEEASGQYSLYECIQLTEAKYHRSRPQFEIAENANFSTAIANAQTGNSPQLSRRIIFDVSCLIGIRVITGIQRVTLEYVRALAAMAEAGLLELEFVAARNNTYERYELDVQASAHEAPRFLTLGAPFQFHFSDQLFIADIRLDWLDQTFTAVARAKQAGAIVTFQVHDLIAMVNTGWVDPKLTMSIFVRWSQILRFADRIVAVSRKVARDIACFVTATSMVGLSPTRRLPVAYCTLGCDPASLPHVQSKGFVFPSGSPALMATGSFTDRKGTIPLVAAMQMLWDEGLPCSLVVSGMDIDRGAIRKQLSTHQHLNEKLFFPGYLPDAEMFQAYRQCSALVYPALDEGFGLPLVEAAHLGCPIIARDIEIFRETSGGEAFFFENGDAGKIAEGLRKWFALTRKKQLEFVPAKSLVTWRQSAAMLTEIMFQGAACFALDIGVRASMNLVVPRPAGDLARQGDAP